MICAGPDCGQDYVPAHMTIYREAPWCPRCLWSLALQQLAAKTVNVPVTTSAHPILPAPMVPTRRRGKAKQRLADVEVERIL